MHTDPTPAAELARTKATLHGGSCSLNFIAAVPAGLAWQTELRPLVEGDHEMLVRRLPLGLAPQPSQSCFAV